MPDWEALDRVMLSYGIPVFFGLVGGIATALGLAIQGSLWWFTSFIPLALLLLWVLIGGSYKAWGEKADLASDAEEKLSDLLKPKLTILKGASHTDTEGKVWLCIVVGNPTFTPIGQCYGKLIRFTPLLNGEPNQEAQEAIQSPEYGFSKSLPQDGHRFLWEPSQLSDTEITIGARSEDRLYFAYATGDKDGPNWTAFWVPGAVGASTWRLAKFHEYEMDIEIGSQVESMSPSHCLVKFNASLDEEFCILRVDSY